MPSSLALRVSGLGGRDGGGGALCRLRARQTTTMTLVTAWAVGDMDGAEQQGQDSRPRRIKKAGKSGRCPRHGRYCDSRRVQPYEAAAASRAGGKYRYLAYSAGTCGRPNVVVVTVVRRRLRLSGIAPEAERHPHRQDGNKWAMQALINGVNSVFPVRHRPPSPPFVLSLGLAPPCRVPHAGSGYVSWPSVVQG